MTGVPVWEEGRAPRPSILPPEPFFGPRNGLPGEAAHGGYTLLKRDDPSLWLGSDDGAVVYGTILPGGDLPEAECRRPVRLRDQAGVQGFSPYRRTRERVLFDDGAMVQSAVAFPGRDIPMYAFVHPVTQRECVAGFDPIRRVWVVED